MSLSLLTRQDVESWVPEPAPSKGGSGLVARLFTTICRAVSSLTERVSRTEAEVYQRCRNEFERLFLWGQGLAVPDGDLDEKLAFSKELHFQVLSLLWRLGTVTLQCLSRTAAPPSSSLAAQCEDLQSLLNTTEGLLHETDPPNGADRPQTPTGSDISDHDMVDLIEEVSIYVDCLLDLTSSLDNPARDLSLEDLHEPSTSPKETFQVSSEEALIYSRRIRDRFKGLPKYLVERLAEANTMRAAALRERRSQPTKGNIPADDGITESLFSTTDHGVTKSTVTSTSFFPSTIQSSSAWSRTEPLPIDDAVSEATFASFSTTASALGMGRPRVPPMPETQDGVAHCPICLLHIPHIQTRKNWK